MGYVPPPPFRDPPEQKPDTPIRSSRYYAVPEHQPPPIKSDREGQDTRSGLVHFVTGWSLLGATGLLFLLFDPNNFVFQLVGVLFLSLAVGALVVALGFLFACAYVYVRDTYLSSKLAEKPKRKRKHDEDDSSFRLGDDGELLFNDEIPYESNMQYDTTPLPPLPPLPPQPPQPPQPPSWSTYTHITHDPGFRQSFKIDRPPPLGRDRISE